jgi:hypothetical protein
MGVSMAAPISEPAALCASNVADPPVRARPVVSARAAGLRFAKLATVTLGCGRIGEKIRGGAAPYPAGSWACGGAVAAGGLRPGDDGAGCRDARTSW